MLVDCDATPKVVYDYQFLQILRIRLASNRQWVVRRLMFEEPNQIESEEVFGSLSKALDHVQKEVQLEERYATPIDIPGLNEGTMARLNGELPRFFCVDPNKLETNPYCNLRKIGVWSVMGVRWLMLKYI